MPPLSWNNVAAPDFSGAAQGFNQFSSILGNALSGLKAGVGGFDAAKSDLINNQLAVALAQQPNAGAAQQAVASGRVGGIDLTDPNVIRRLNDANLKAISPEQMALLGMDQTKTAVGNLDFSQRQAQDGQAPQIATALGMLRDPAATAAQKAQASLDLANLNYSGTGAEFASNLNRSAQLTEANQTSNASSAFTLGKDQQNYADARQGADIGAEIAKAAAGPQDVDNLLASKYSQGPDGKPINGNTYNIARARALELLNGAGGGGGAAGAGGGSGGGGATGAGPAAMDPNAALPGYNTVFGNGKYGSPDKPLTSMTLGDVQGFQTKLIDATKGKIGQGNLGSGAVGMYQINSDTLKQYAPKVLGTDWQGQAFTPENQDKLAEAIFNDRKGGNLASTWVSLPDSRPGAYAKVPWSQMRNVIAKGEVGVSPDQLAAGGAIVNTALQNEISQALSNSIAAGFSKASQDTSDVQTVAKKLKTTVFTDGHVDEGRIVADLQEIQARGQKEGVQISPAIAAEILKSSTSGQGFLGRMFAGNLGAGSNLGNGQAVNYDKVDDYVNQIKTNQLPNAMATYARIQAAQGPLLLAQQRYSQALQVLNEASQAAHLKKGYDMNLLAEAQARYAQATKDLQGAQQSAAGAVSDAKYFGQQPQANNAPSRSKPVETPGKPDLRFSTAGSNPGLATSAALSLLSQYGG